MRRSLHLRRENRFYAAIMLPALLFLLLLMIYPLVSAFLTSLTNLNLVRPREVERIGAANYVQAFKDSFFLNSMKNNAWFTPTSVLFQLVAGFFIAYLLNYSRLSFRGTYRTLLLLPMFVANVVVGFQWKWLLIDRYGVVNHILHGLFGTREIYWLTDTMLAKLSVIATDSWNAIPFMVLVLHASMQSIPPDLTDAAQIDGASGWQQVRYIILPAIRSAVLVVLLIRVMDSIKTFDQVFVLTRGGPANETELMTLYVFRQAFTSFNMGYASALSYIEFVLILLFSILLIRGFVRR